MRGSEQVLAVRTLWRDTVVGRIALIMGASVETPARCDAGTDTASHVTAATPRSATSSYPRQK